MKLSGSEMGGVTYSGTLMMTDIDMQLISNTLLQFIRQNSV